MKLALLMFTLGCSFAPSSRALQQTNATNSNHAQIVIGYSTLGKWVNKARGATARQDRRALFESVVLGPILDKCFPRMAAEDALRSLEGTIGNPADWDLQVVAREIHELQAHRSEIVATLRSTMSAAGSQLTAPQDIAVCVLYFSPFWGPAREQFNGGFGFTPSGSSIQLFVAPVGSWLSTLSLMLAHEYHHAGWMQLNPSGHPASFDLVDTLVFEGRADHFARIVTGVAAPWTDALSHARECEVVSVLLPGLHGRSVTWYVLNHDPSGRFPAWSGYTIAYRLVGAYLRKHPNLSIKDWTTVAPEDLFDRSEYLHSCHLDREVDSD